MRTYRDYGLFALTTLILLCGGHSAIAQSADTTTGKADPSTSTSSPDKPRRQFHFGPSLDLFVPQSALLRDHFGKAWTSIGLDFGKRELPGRKVRLDFQPQMMSSSRNGNHALVILPELRSQIGFSEGPIRPFLGLNAGPIITETRVTSENLPTRWRGGFGGGVTGGIGLSDKGLLTLGYEWSSRVRGFDFSGMRAGASWRF